MALPQIGQTISADEFNKLPGIGETISAEQFNALPENKSAEIQPEENIPFVPRFAEPLVRGAAKVGEFLGMKPLATSIAEKISGAPQTYTPKQIFGSAIQTGALAVPIGQAATLGGKIASAIGVGGAIGFGKGLEQKQSLRELGKQTILSSAISGLVPVGGQAIGTGITKAKPVIGDIVSSVLGNTIGKPPEVIKAAFSNHQKVADAISRQVIPVQVRTEAINALRQLKEATRKSFSGILQNEQKLNPLGQAGTVLAKKQFGLNPETLANSLRDFRISVSAKNGVLNFQKFNSPIVSSIERKNIQEAFNTIIGQKDFRPEGIQAIAAKLTNLSKIKEGGITAGSAAINSLHDKYVQSISKLYPRLAQERSKYAREFKIYEELDDILKSEKLKPTQVRSSISKLSNIYKEDNELYLGVLKKLENATGKDFLLDLAGSEFLRIAPSSFGSRIAQAGLLAGGFLYNPFILLALPIFSPRFVGGLTIKAGQVAKQLPRFTEPTGEAISEIAPKLVPQLFNRQQQP